MKEGKGLFNFTALMISFLGMLCMFPQISNALTEVTTDNCQVCHTPTILHEHLPGTENCLECHTSVPGDVPVLSSRCVDCHGNPVDVVAAAHEPVDSSCIVCHPCVPVTTVCSVEAECGVEVDECGNDIVCDDTCGSEETCVENMCIAPENYSISGTVSGCMACHEFDTLAGVPLSLTGDDSDETSTADNGAYSFMVEDGSYTVTPSLAGHLFNPTSREVAVSGADETGVDFAAVGDVPGDEVEIALEDYDLRIWDFSGPVIDSRGNNVLRYTLIVDVKGKVTGSGTYEAEVNGVSFSIPVEVKGNVKGKNINEPKKSENIITLKYKVSGKDDLGNKVKDDVKLELEESFTSLVGSQKRKTCAKGQGCINNTTDFSLPVPAGMTGEASISISTLPISANDKKTKYEGTAELELSNGDEYALPNAKGTYTNKKDETKYQLKGDKEANTQGIKTKLTLNGRKDGPATFINGKALGQKIKYKLE